MDEDRSHNSGLRIRHANADGTLPGYEHLHAQLREAYAPILEVQASISAQLDAQIASIAREINDVVANIGQQIAAFPPLTVRIPSSLIDVHQLFAREFAGFREAWRAIEELEAEVAPTLRAANWWMEPSWPMYQAVEVLRIARKGKPALVTRHVLAMHRPGRRQLLAQLVREWTLPEFARRKRFFADALWAMRRERWSLVVPLLLSQLEGVIREFCNLEIGLSGVVGAERRKIERLLRRQTFPGVADGFYETTRDLLVGVYTNDAVALSSLRRDAVLHGNDISFATEAQALRAFLLLDTVHSHFERVRRTSGRDAQRATKP